MSQEKTIINLPDDLSYAVYKDDVAAVESIFEANKFNIDQKFGLDQQSIVEIAFQFRSEKVLSSFLEKGADASKIKIEYSTRKEFFFKHISELIKNGFDLLDNLPSIIANDWRLRTREVKEQHKNILDNNLKSFIADKKIDANLKINFLSEEVSLLSMTLRNYYDQYLPKTAEYLLDNGARADNIVISESFFGQPNGITIPVLTKLLNSGMNIHKNIKFFARIENFDETLLANYILTHSTQVNDPLPNHKAQLSLLGFALEAFGNEANSYHSKTVEALLAKGARADGIIFTDRNTKTIINHLSELINSGFNIKNNFGALANFLNDETISNLLEQNFIQPELRYTGKRYASWRDDEIEISLFDLICQRKLSQALQVMAQKGFELAQDWVVPSVNYEAEFYKSNLLTLAKMGLNTSEIARFIKSGAGLAEEVLFDLVNNNILDVNFIVDSIYKKESILYIALEKGMQNLTTLLLEKGADASELKMPLNPLENITRSYLINLDALIKNGFKILDNLNSLIDHKDFGIEQAKLLIEKGLLKSTDLLAYMRSSYQLKDELKSKEFLEYLFEKGLNLDDEVPNTQNFVAMPLEKVSIAIVSLFSSEALMALFKNGLLKVSEETIINLLRSFHNKQDVIIRLLKDGLLSLDLKINDEPLIMKCYNQHEISEYLINNGSFDKLDQAQKEEFVQNTINSRIRSLVEFKTLNIIKLLTEQHEYKLREIDLYATLLSSSKELIQYAIDNGLDISKPYTLNANIMGADFKGLYPLQIYLRSYSYSFETIKFLVEKGADIFVKTPEGYPLSSFASHQEFKNDALLYFYEKGVKPHQIDFANLYGKNEWQNLEKYFADLNWNELFLLPNKDLFPSFYYEYPRFKDVECGTLAHLIAAKGSKEAMEYLIADKGNKEALEYLIKQNIDINATDSSGKTPIFYAANKEIAEFLFANGAKTDVVDNAGNTLLHSTSDIELLKVFSKLGANQDATNNDGQKWYKNKSIKQLIENDLLPNWKEIPELVNNALQKGNIIEAAFLENKGGSISYDLRHDIVESIKAGILASNEVNKFQALVGILTKNGIQLPSFLHKYLNDPKDYENTNELEIVLNNQFLNALVDKYLAQFELNEGNKCLTEYSKYAVSMSQVVKQIEEDLALEVLAINKLTLVPLTEEHFVYRGLRLTDVEGFISHNFLHGHKALLKTGVHNFGFHANEPWSKTEKVSYSWEFSGNYVSFSKSMAEGFAGGNKGTSSLINSGGVLMQIKVGPETKFVCGRNSVEYELITLSTIPVEAIKSITIVGTGQIISNPNYIESALDNTKPLNEVDMIANYKAMGCEQYVNSNKEKMKNGGELSSYEKFIETLTPAELAEHRKKVYLAAEPEMCFAE
jgi:hypothetical protein